MEELVAFGSPAYLVLLGLLVVARAMDFLSTWVATPSLVLEGNPIAKKLGWRWGIAVNVAMCVAFAFWPLPAITITTTSVLVAARNFQSAWLMRSMGEELYRRWHVARIQETPAATYVFCLAGNTLLTAAVGVALMVFSNFLLVPFGIGMGIVGYAVAVAVYTSLAVWRMRRDYHPSKIAEGEATAWCAPESPRT